MPETIQPPARGRDGQVASLSNPTLEKSRARSREEQVAAAIARVTGARPTAVARDGEPDGAGDGGATVTRLARGSAP